MNYSFQCEWRTHGKQTEFYLKGDNETVTEPNEEIHSDAYSPMPVPSLSVRRQFASFTDFWSAFNSFYLISKKTKVLSKLEEPCTMFESLSNCRVKHLYSGNRGDSEGLISYLLAKDIGVQTTAPHNP